MNFYRLNASHLFHLEREMVILNLTKNSTAVGSRRDPFLERIFKCITVAAASATASASGRAREKISENFSLFARPREKRERKLFTLLYPPCRAEGGRRRSFLRYRIKQPMFFVLQRDRSDES